MYGESVLLLGDLLQSTVILFSRSRSNKPGQLVVGFVRNGWWGGSQPGKTFHNMKEALGKSMFIGLRFAFPSSHQHSTWQQTINATL
ncbi:hypothetical protein V6N13_105328 [Hibiscus sabdariffa]